MKLGVFTVLFQELSLEDMLARVKQAGLDTVEIGTGGYPGNAHCKIDELLESEDALKQYEATFEKYGVAIGAFSCHGNPISPDKAFAEESDWLLRKTIKLAAKMGVPVVNCFSGVAGSEESATKPNWPVTAWPTEYGDVLNWQWEEKLVPYWKELGTFAEEHQVKIALELHGGFLVHTPYTMLKLRELTSDAIGANFDPSHMWWQGIDPTAAIKILGKAGAIHHFHAKDTYIDPDNVNMYGLTDMQPYSNIKQRAWNFRTVGLGHGQEEWNKMISALRTYDYDYVISIEHEDSLMSIEEGFQRAVDNLKNVVINEPATTMWWS